MVILTDLSEVLVRGAVGVEGILNRKFGEGAGNKFLALHEHNEHRFKELLRDEITEDAYWDVMLRNADVPFNAEDLKEALSENMKHAIPGTVKLYESIVASPRTSGDNNRLDYNPPRIVIVSDHIREREEEILTAHPGIFALADKIVWTWAYRQIKQDEGFFTRLLKHLKLRPEEAFLVDDSPVNILAARKAGIAGTVFRDGALLKETLKFYGFKFA